MDARRRAKRPEHEYGKDTDAMSERCHGKRTRAGGMPATLFVQAGSAPGTRRPIRPAISTSVLRSPRCAGCFHLIRGRCGRTGPGFSGSMLARTRQRHDHATTPAPSVRRAKQSASGSSSMAAFSMKPEAGADALIEAWQANAGGRYRHKKDGYLAPLRSEFRWLRSRDDGTRTAAISFAPSSRDPIRGPITARIGGPRISISRFSARPSRRG